MGFALSAMMRHMRNVFYEAAGAIHFGRLPRHLRPRDPVGNISNAGTLR
jgi:hypothetical protein